MKRKTKDPLISFRDERLLVWHWATVYNIKEVWVSPISTNYVVLHDTSDDSFRLSISINRSPVIEVNRAYTIKQLCGEVKNE